MQGQSVLVQLQKTGIPRLQAARQRDVPLRNSWRPGSSPAFSDNHFHDETRRLQWDTQQKNRPNTRPPLTPMSARIQSRGGVRDFSCTAISVCSVFAAFVRTSHSSVCEYTKTRKIHPSWAHDTRKMQGSKSGDSPNRKGPSA